MAAAWVSSMISSGAPTADADKEGDFKFRFVGPKVGNRIAAVAGRRRETIEATAREGAA